MFTLCDLVNRKLHIHNCKHWKEGEKMMGKGGGRKKALEGMEGRMEKRVKEKGRREGT